MLKATRLQVFNHIMAIEAFNHKVAQTAMIWLKSQHGVWGHLEHASDGADAQPFGQGTHGPHQHIGRDALAMPQRAVRLEAIPLADGAVPLPPGAATRMPVGTEVPPASPAPIGAVGMRAAVERGVHLAGPSPRGHDAGWRAPRRLG